MWLSIHAAFTEEGGGGSGGKEKGGTEGSRGWRRGRYEEEEKGGRDGGLRGREVVFLFFLAQGEGKTIGVQMDASPLFLDDPPLPLPPPPPSSRPFLLSALAGCLERGTPRRGGLLGQHLCKIWINKIAEGVCLTVCVCVSALKLFACFVFLFFFLFPSSLFVCESVFMCWGLACLSKEKGPQCPL